jgi:glycosyltransferase involved in cell wall biosynthesis
MISVFTISFNEEVMLPFLIKWYRGRFPGCKITIWDNESTDDTVRIAKAMGAEVGIYKTGGRLSDRTFRDIKNTCYQNADTDWVVVCDVDELIDVTEDELRAEELKGTTILDCSCWNVVNKEGVKSIAEMNYGLAYPGLTAKRICFNKSKVKAINFDIGAHIAYPEGEIVFSHFLYNLYHYKWLGFRYVVNRYKLFASRLSEENLKNKWSYHYKFSPLRLYIDWKILCWKAYRFK